MCREPVNSCVYFVGVNHFDPLGSQFLSECFTAIKQKQNGHQPLFVAVEYAREIFEKLCLLRSHFKTELQNTFQSYSEEFLERIASTLVYEPTMCMNFWSNVPVAWLLNGLPKKDQLAGRINSVEAFLTMRIRTYQQFFADATLNGSLDAGDLSKRLSVYLRQPQPNTWPNLSRENHIFAQLSRHARSLPAHRYAVVVLGASHLDDAWDSVYTKCAQLGFQRCRWSIWKLGH